MSLWLVLGAMTVVAAVLVAWPLLRPRRQQADRRDYELRVYRAQLEEVTREEERGLLGPKESAAARLEVERRMLAADAATAERRGTPAGGARRPVAALGLLACFLLVAGALYGRLGSPDLPARPFAQRADRQVAGRAPDSSVAAAAQAIARLEQRLASAPDDLDAWLQLGQAYETTGQFEESAHAWRQALALDTDNARLHAALGEALVMANGGTVTPAAGDAFDRALELDTADPRARFYRGLALLQQGDRRGAFDAWVAMIETSPGDAPWLPEVQRRVASLADQLGLEPADLPAPAASRRGPTDEQMRDAETMSAEDRAAMIRDMVAGLAARLADRPDDIEGWRMLGRSYQMLGQHEQSADAYRHVAEALPDDLAAQNAYANALLAAAPNDMDSPALAGQMARVLALDRDNPSALFYLGQAAAQAGDAASARAHWQRLIAQVPPDAPERAQIQQMIDQLPPAD
jgi:cytochrome c-type biogenesis protein CcmH